MGVVEDVTVGSSLKLCMLARGEARLYPRFGPTWTWDTAAGQAILEAAGGAVLRLDGTPLAYDRDGDHLNPDFAAAADLALAQRTVAVMRGLRA
jgi:3'(2'), 5'-bisphosphate nucleotidase